MSEWKATEFTYAIASCPESAMPHPSGACPPAERVRTILSSCGRMPPSPSAMARVDRSVAKVIRTMYSSGAHPWLRAGSVRSHTRRSRPGALVRSRDMHRYAFFDTELGRCAIAWGPDGIAGVELPSGDDAVTRRRMSRSLPGAVEGTPPPEVEDAIGAIARLFAGAPDDLSGIRLDMTPVAEFDQRVYEVTRAIPPGATLSYGEVAQRLGEPGAAQAVGRALGRNPFPIVVPCHRVVAADGTLRGFSAPGGVATKRRMLALEGAGAPTLFD